MPDNSNATEYPNPESRPNAPSARPGVRLIRTLDGHGCYGDEGMRRNVHEPDASDDTDLM